MAAALPVKARSRPAASFDMIKRGAGCRGGEGPSSMAVVEERFARLGGHRTFYLAAGPEDGPLVVFVHGFPELSLSWRHQLPVFGGLGFRAVAPDLRGCGRSTVYGCREDYAQECLVEDMVGL